MSSRRRMAGLSLIEMMIALVMALIVAAGIITVFTSTSSSNKVQQQMATLQEEGRFAIHSLRTDLANANGGYCSNSGGNAGITGSGLALDALRSPTIYSEAAIAFPDNTLTLPDPTSAYSLPSQIYMRGYQCTATACTPADPNTNVSAIPAMGKAVGDRVVGADVLTIRYLKPGSGWVISPSTVTAGSHMKTVGATTTITLNPITAAGEPSASAFKGSLAMLADCSNAQVFAVTDASGVLTVLGTGNPGNYAQPLDISNGAAPRVFDFLNDFQTITYYLKVVCADSSTPCAHTTGELERRVNGTDQPLVRGVERLNFRYGIVNGNGGTQFLTAAEVDSGVDVNGNSLTCPPGVSTPGGMPDDPANGCLWRAVQTIEVHVLMDGQTPLYTLTPQEMNYIYTPDGGATPTVPTAPSAHTIQPNADQGFPEQLLRREFVTLVSLRNFNP
jgi:type IV pilus assembly protein PilW